MRHFAARIFLAAAAFISPSCSASFPTQPTTPAPVVGLEIRSFTTSLTGALRIGTFVTLDAYTVDADGLYTSVSSKASWFSSNPSVVRINSQLSLPLLSLESPGTADVTATYQGFVASVTITVISR
jgi:hypothetical protein